MQIMVSDFLVIRARFCRPKGLQGMPFSIRSTGLDSDDFTQVYLGGVIYFGMNNALASTSAFLPTIIKSFGFSAYITQNAAFLGVY